MNTKSFFTETLGKALELGIGSADDVLRHVTPELLAQHLPRALWARLLTACLGAPRVDAQLVVDTIGVPNLCEHIPGPVIWQVIAQIAARSLGQPYTMQGEIVTRSATTSPLISKSTAHDKRSVLAPPPEAMPAQASSSGSGAVGPNIPPPANQPLADLITELEADERPITPTRTRPPTSQRFRQAGTGIGRLGASSQPSSLTQRRPQAAVPTPPAKAAPRHTEIEDVETDVADRNQREIAVDDSQLVDWQSTETTQSSDEDFSDIRKRER